MSPEQSPRPRARSDAGPAGRQPAGEPASLHHTGGQGAGAAAAEPAGVVWVAAGRLHARGPDDRTRVWDTADGPDRVLVTPARRRETVEDPGETSAGAVPWERDFPWDLGRAAFCRGEEVLLDLPLDVWGPGVYAPTSPAWSPDAPDVATGVRPLAVALGVPLEHRADLPAPRPGSALAVTAHPRVERALALLRLLMVVLMLVAATAALVTRFSGHGDWFFLGAVFALGCTQLAWVLGATWLQVAGWRRRRRREGTVLLEPVPAGLVGRGFWRSARVLLWHDRFVFRSADGRERAAALPDDANGVSAVVVRGRGTADDRRPYRVQFCARNGTVLAELGWDDWFGGPGGADRLRELCCRWDLSWQEDEVLPDDMPARLAPWDARQAGDSYPARAHPRTTATLASAITVVAFWSGGAGLHWLTWPAWAAVAGTVFTGAVPWLVRKAWLAARVDPTGSVARSAGG